MNILEIGVMRGPSYWSVKHHQLIVLTLDIQETIVFTNWPADHFIHTVEKLLPGICIRKNSLNGHIHTNTWIGYLIERIALALQNRAGMHTEFGLTCKNDMATTCQVVFAYQEEEAGKYAAKAAVRLGEAVLENRAYDVQADILALKNIAAHHHPGPTTGSIIDEAKKRNVPVFRFDNLPIIQFGYGIHQKRIRASISSQTSSIGVDIACNKDETKNLLEASAIPVPKGKVISTEEELQQAIAELNYPLVIKPLDGNQGKGTTIYITTWTQARQAFTLATRISRQVIVEKYISGFDFRLLVINYKLVAAAKRIPACVKGDGYSTIAQLIEAVNSDPRRGTDHENVLTSIKVDECTKGILAEKNLTLHSVLKEKEVLYLKLTANLSTGGTSVDITDQVHPENVEMAERIARIVGLDICGIDVMAPDMTRPITRNGGAILEVNAAPGFRMHLSPAEGMPRNVAAPVLDMLYPKGSEARIPIIAVTGTNGKTTTARLIAHIAAKAGHQVGYTTTDGIYINGRLMVKGDCTGPDSAAFVLKDPTVDFAVLECARGGILRSGLGFDKCDIGIVTNVSADHLGLKGIDSLEQMARVKRVIPETVHKEGYALLNAEDDLVYDMAKEVDCNIALFGIDENNPRVRRHCEQGGLAAFVENGFITICEGKWKTRIEKVVNVPLTYSGKAGFMIQNVLPAVLTAYIRGFSVKDIRQGLQTFIPSPEQMPGRLNIFEFSDFKVMIDYAHNPGAIQALGRFLQKVEASARIGIITGVGDRRDEDIIELGKLSAQVFDEIIIRQDQDLRGWKDMEVAGLLMKGIGEVDRYKPVQVITNESESLLFAIKSAKKGAFITLCTEDIAGALQVVRRCKTEEDKFGIVIGSSMDEDDSYEPFNNKSHPVI